MDGWMSAPISPNFGIVPSTSPHALLLLNDWETNTMELSPS